jgi:hypothetical protein
MISREDFMFTAGYEGNTAIVNVRLKRSSARLSALQLAEKGLFKPAVSAAVFDKDEPSLERILAIYNSHTEKSLDSVDALKRTLGVQEVYDSIERVLYA